MPEFLETLSAEQTEQFWRLVRLYQVTRQSFIAFALFGQASDWDNLERALRIEPSLNLKTLFVPSGNISAHDPNFLPALRALGPERSLVLIRVDYGASDVPLTRFAGYLNLHREELMRLPHGFVFWFTEPALVVAARVAADTYAVKRGVFDFRSQAEITLPGGESGLWLRDILERPERISEVENLIKAERSSATPNIHYVAQLELRLAEALFQNGRVDLAFHHIGYAVIEARALRDTPLLADALNAFGIVLSEVGKREEALEAAQEGVELYRTLAKTQPEVFNPNLAGSLNNLGNRLGSLGRYEEALEAAQEGVELYRTLARTQPEVFNPLLAKCLYSLGNHLDMLKKWEESKRNFQESIRCIVPSWKTYPSVFNQDLKIYVGSYLRTLKELGQEPEEDVLNTIQALEKLSLDLPKLEQSSI